MIQDSAGMLVGQDFGAWSRADIERIAGAAGWSVRDDEHSLTIETGGPVQARSTKISYGQDGFGYGDQIDRTPGTSSRRACAPCSSRSPSTCRL